MGELKSRIFLEGDQPDTTPYPYVDTALTVAEIADTLPWNDDRFLVGEGFIVAIDKIVAVVPL